MTYSVELFGGEKNGDVVCLHELLPVLQFARPGDGLYTLVQYRLEKWAVRVLDCVWMYYVYVEESVSEARKRTYRPGQTHVERFYQPDENSWRMDDDQTRRAERKVCKACFVSPKPGTPGILPT